MSAALATPIETQPESAQLTQERSERGQYTDYSIERKAEVLALLEANDGNIKRTARESGIDHATIRYWQANQDRFREFQPQQRRDLAQRFENNVHLALDLAQTKAQDASYAQLMTGAAIATDKMQLLRSQPTQITANVNIESLTITLQQVIAEITSTDTDS